jgi:hypothetical protein
MSNTVIYALDDYTNEGFLKPTKYLWLIWFFLCRGWILFVLAAASRSQNDDVLPILLPSMSELYGLMLSALPIAAIMWLIGLRNRDRLRLNRTLEYGFVVTLLVVIVQFVITANVILQQAGHFSWSYGITLLILFWSLLYLNTSKRARASFNNVTL